MWALSDSEAIQTIIKEKYKQQRHSDDENQPLSVQPWGFDGDKRRYFLIQGLDDTSFRIYREGDRYKKTAHWWSVAGTIDEAKELAKKMEEVDGSQAARRFAGKITNAIPMFEATEEVCYLNNSYLMVNHMLTTSSRSGGAANTAKYGERPSLGLSLASRSTKVAHVASAHATSTTMKMLSYLMQLLLDGQPDSQVDPHHLRPCQLQL